jgi:hypothetical protein
LRRYEREREHFCGLSDGEKVCLLA